MHITIDQSLWAIAPEDLNLHAQALEEMLITHFYGQHLVCLSPRDIEQFKALPGFGPIARATISQIASKNQDYFSSMRLSTLSINVFGEGGPHLESTPSRRNLKIDDLPTSLIAAPYLFVENAQTDGRFYDLFFTEALNQRYGIGSLVNVSPFHGGGSSLGGVMRDVVKDRARGLSICDRDCSAAIPPLVANSTSEGVASALRDLALINDDFGPSDHLAAFHYVVTFGWGLENFLGPNLVDLLSSVFPLGQVDRSIFVEAFPTFPVLSDQETELWFLVNFKDVNQDAEALRQGAQARFSQTLTDQQAQSIAALRLPGNSINETVSLLSGTRHSNPLRTAIHRDLSNVVYRSAVMELARLSHACLAADKAARFS